MVTNGGGELLNDQDLAALEAEMQRLAQDKKQCEQMIQELRQKEDPGQGIFHAREIFDRQQEKLRIQVEIDLRRAKKNRYLMAKEWGSFSQ